MHKIGIECESIEGPESWGVGRIVKELLEEISKRPELANEFKFFLYFKSKIPNYPWLASPIFIKKIIFGHSNILKNIGVNSFSLYYYIFLPIRLWFERFDFVFFPNYMLPIMFRGKSLVMLTEDIYYEINSGTLPLRYKLAYKIFAGWWTAKHATKIMAISETSKKEVAKLFKINPDRIVVNRLGVDEPKSTTNYQLQTTNYILYIGQAFPRRHLRETMLAFELLAPQYPELKLVAVGHDKYNPPIIQKLTSEINGRLKAGRIIYKEYVSEDELAELYANAKLLVYVSSKEAFGIPPLEALTYGTPAVVADTEVSHEIFGNSAFFARPELAEGLKTYTPESIADTIIRGLTDRQKHEQIKNARKGVLEKYTWQNFTEKLLQTVKLFR